MLLGVNHHWGTYSHISCREFTRLHSAHVLSFTANVHEGKKRQQIATQGGGRSAGAQREEGREGDAVAERVEAVVNTNLNYVKRGQRAKLASVCGTAGGEGDGGEEKGVGRGGERVGQLRSIVTGQLCMH